MDRWSLYSPGSHRWLPMGIRTRQLTFVVIAVLIVASLIIMLRDYLLISAALIPGLAARPSSSWGSSSSRQLKFSRNGTFQISVFEDLHYGEAEDLDWGPEQDVMSEYVMNTVLNSEHPDLVVINGDLITGENTFRENSTHYVDEIVRPLVARNLKWASTYGNHDSQYNLSREGIYAREQLWSNSLTGNMVDDSNAGVTNYYLEVFSSQVAKTTPELILWFFDSRGGFMYQESDSDGNTVGQDEWVHQSVVDWFVKTRTQLQKKYRKTVPSLAFYHIPVNAMLEFQNLGVSSTKEPGINDDIPLAQQGLASNGSYIGADIPFMTALLSTPGLIATFSGHDHGDDWCFKWTEELTLTNLTGNGLNLCFSRHTGYGGYGSWMRGSRQILIDERSVCNGEVTTWNRLENGNITGLVSLNATYGQDNYPTVPELYTNLP